jgi:hypothetical protein
MRLRFLVWVFLCLMLSGCGRLFSSDLQGQVERTGEPVNLWPTAREERAGQ